MLPLAMVNQSMACIDFPLQNIGKTMVCKMVVQSMVFHHGKSMRSPWWFGMVNPWAYGGPVLKNGCSAPSSMVIQTGAYGWYQVVACHPPWLTR